MCRLPQVRKDAYPHVIFAKASDEPVSAGVVGRPSHCEVSSHGWMGKMVVKLLFLLGILGMLLSYPAYFYLLFEFKTRMMRDHPDLWRRRESGALSYSGQSAYSALRSVRDGSLMV